MSHRFALLPRARFDGSPPGDLDIANMQEGLMEDEACELFEAGVVNHLRQKRSAAS